MSSTKAMMSKFSLCPITNKVMPNTCTEPVLSKADSEDDDMALKLRECFTTIGDPTLTPR